MFYFLQLYKDRVNKLLFPLYFLKLFISSLFSRQNPCVHLFTEIQSNVMSSLLPCADIQSPYMIFSKNLLLLQHICWEPSVPVVFPILDPISSRPSFFINMKKGGRNSFHEQLYTKLILAAYAFLCVVFACWVTSHYRNLSYFLYPFLSCLRRDLIIKYSVFSVQWNE